MMSKESFKSMLAPQKGSPAVISRSKAKAEDNLTFNVPGVIMAITKFKKTWLAGRRVAVQTIGLPLPGQKNLLKLAFSAPKSPKGTLIQTAKVHSYTFNNQQYTKCTWGTGGPYLGFKTTSTDFEFNKPILKNSPRILKDFEKNSTDFERF